MLSPCRLFLGLLFSVLFLPVQAAPRPDGAEGHGTASISIAVADFTGADKELGRFLAETLLTNLAQSSKLQLVERNEIRQALSELKLQSTGVFEPSQVKKLGKLVSADRILVGGYLVRDEQIIINARLLDVRTGKLAPGGATNVSGKKSDLLPLTNRLARQFHKRVTGEDLELDGDSTPAFRVGPKPAPDEANGEPDSNSAETISDSSSLRSLRSTGFVPKNARPDDIVREAQLLQTLNKVSQKIDVQTPNALNVSQPNAPLTRLRAITAFVKLLLTSDAIALYRTSPTNQRVPDMGQTPAWGLPYLQAALQEGWWREEDAFQARRTATWGFIADLLLRLPLDLSTQAQAERTRLVNRPEPEDPDTFTGLIIEAFDYKVERTMGPRILDEDGRIVYPDQKHLPDYDYLLDNGLAGYYHRESDASRAGKRPLVVRAIDVVGPLKGDMVVTNATAEKIRQANRTGKFLSRWAVCILTTPGD